MAGSEGSSAFAEGAPCWIDAQLPDVEAGRRFYGGLFGWTFDETGPNGPTGPGGPTGSGGPSGPSGPSGGPVGPGGPGGPGDPSGPAGLAGPAGPAGSTDPAGPADPTGPVGPDDSTHPTHPAGPAAPTAPSTPTAPTGAGSPRQQDGPYRGAVWAYLGGEPVAALVPKRDGRMPTVWTVHFATPDARALCDRIRKEGGQIVTAPVPVGTYGTGALAADPEGAVFGLWQPGTHPGFGGRPGPDAARAGTFGWVELYARDTAVADAFYPGLFHDALFGPGVTRAFGRAPVTDVFPAEMPPHFLVHFAVRDCEAALAAVTRLGGRVQAPPFDASYGRVAVVGDNQGASFALLQRRDAP